MISAFYAVLIALMHAVEAQIGGLVIRCRREELTDGHRHRSGFTPLLAPLPVIVVLRQVIQMRGRDYDSCYCPGCDSC